MVGPELVEADEGELGEGLVRGAGGAVLGDVGEERFDGAGELRERGDGPGVGGCERGAGLRGVRLFSRLWQLATSAVCFLATC